MKASTKAATSIRSCAPTTLRGTWKASERLFEPAQWPARTAAPSSIRDAQQDALKAACAEDREIWDIYANNFGPEGFDASIKPLYRANPGNRTFVLFDGDEPAGMSSFLGIDGGPSGARNWRQRVPAEVSRHLASTGVSKP